MSPLPWWEQHLSLSGLSYDLTGRLRLVPAVTHSGYFLVTLNRVKAWKSCFFLKLGLRCKWFYRSSLQPSKGSWHHRESAILVILLCSYTLWQLTETLVSTVRSATINPDIHFSCFCRTSPAFPKQINWQKNKTCKVWQGWNGEFQIPSTVGQLSEEFYRNKS